MKYNSQKEDLIISEYGRNLQNLVTHAMGIQDKEKKQQFCNGLIKLMHQISPQTRNTADSQEIRKALLLVISEYFIVK